MSTSNTALDLVVTRLGAYGRPPSAGPIYDFHDKANLVIPSVTVEVETIAPLTEDGAITNQELVDNWIIQLSIRIHTGYRLGPVNSVSSTAIADGLQRWLRESINLGSGYRVFDVPGVAYNTDHPSSGTTGAQINVNIHKVEFYEQS